MTATAAFSGSPLPPPPRDGWLILVFMESGGGDIARLNGLGVLFHVGDRDFMIGPDMAEIDDPRRAKDAIEIYINGRFPIFHRMLAKVDMGAGMQQHLYFAGLPEAGAAMIAGHLQLQVDRRGAERRFADGHR